MKWIVTIVLIGMILPVSVGANGLSGPGRGWYKWRGVEMIKTQVYDSYQRYTWRDIEPSRDNYNFGKIDADLAKVGAGQKFGLRIRDMVEPDKNPGVPQYVIDAGWAKKYKETWVPNYDNPSYQERVRKLLGRLAAKYDGDRRVGWVEIGMYGQYGEWHLPKELINAIGGEPSLAARKAVIDAHVAAFSKTRLVMMAKTDGESVKYALERKTNLPIGWRVDCLGRAGYLDFDSAGKYSSLRPVIVERWKTAPVIGEFCPDVTAAEALAQVRKWHFSLVGNGNLNNWQGRSGEINGQFAQIGREAGYEIRVKEIKIQRIENKIQITSVWENVGNAPVYEKWLVEFVANGWTGKSQVDLTKILPGESKEVSDEFETNVQGEMTAQIVDPTGYRANMVVAGGETKYLIPEVKSESPTPSLSPTPTTVGVEVKQVSWWEKLVAWVKKLFKG